MQNNSVAGSITHLLPITEEFRTVTETMKAIPKLSSDKAPGSNAIPVEIFKAGELPMAYKLSELSLHE